MKDGSTVVEVIFKKIFGKGKSSAITNRKNEVILKMVKMHILEMEDVLFHLNSCVVMPENPQGKSSSDGNMESSDESLDITGIKALAIVFKQFEFDPSKRMIIAGHTDTSGTDEFNFKLSDERAKNILYLLIGEKSEWAKLSYGRHKVEDYQQIMKYFEKKLSCECDPGDIDDKWGDNTRAATKNFFNKVLPGKSVSMLAKVENDQKKRWPVEAWEAVYDLYSKEMADVLEVSESELNTRRKSDIKFVDDKKQFVGCGESFPIESKEKNNYRSQKNRRVEILFFDKDETPEINCPAQIKKSHTEQECPLWKKFYFVPLYIDPKDLKSVVYHLQFVYYDKVKRKRLPVPKGLFISAYEDGNKKLPTETIFKDGVYYVKVQFKKTIKDPARTKLYFEFNGTDRWVYTKDDKSDPIVVIMTKKDYDAFSFIERQKYYDLPVKWSSQNYWTRYDGDINKGDRFEKVFKDVQKLKPFGDTTTKPDKPLVFSFDDIVLVDKNGSQNISDRNAFAETANPKGQPKPLSERSRVRILHVDLNDNKLKIYEPDSSGSVDDRYKSSLIRFQKDKEGKFSNLILADELNTRVVVFCGEFYDVTNKRTLESSSLDYSKNNILGCRKAVVNDSDCHFFEVFRHDSAEKTVHCSGIGDFEVHYFHGGGFSKDNIHSFQLIYWSTFFEKDTNPTVGGVGDFRPATQNEVDDFKSSGMINSMNHWNVKEYQYEDEAKKNNIIIKPFFYFEAFEEFSYIPAASFDFTANNYAILFGKDDFKQAIKNSRGGIPKSVSFIVEEKKGSWFLSYRDASNIFSLGSFRIKTREDDVNRFDGFPFSEFGDPGQYGCLVVAHELGHATGQNDDYTETVASSLTKASVPTLGQFGRTEDGNRISQDDSNFTSRVEGNEAYNVQHDKLTMMIKNGPIRMRHVWRFTHWININSKSGKPLNKFLTGTDFKIYYPRAKYSYYRKIEDKLDPWKYIKGESINAAAERPWNVYLFKITDETRKNGDKEFKAILTVRLLLAVAFRNNGANNWSDAEKTNWTNRINNALQTSKNFAKFYLEGSGAFNPTIIRFIPGFNFYNIGSSPSNAGFNYRIEVTKNSNDPITQTGNIIKCGDSITSKMLLNYFFAKPLNTVEIKKEDLKFISDWFSTAAVANAVFTVKTI